MWKHDPFLKEKIMDDPDIQLLQLAQVITRFDNIMENMLVMIEN